MGAEITKKNKLKKIKLIRVTEEEGGGRTLLRPIIHNPNQSLCNRNFQLNNKNIPKSWEHMNVKENINKKF